MSRTKSYAAIYEWDAVDGAWNVRIRGVTGCQTYGRSLRQAQVRIREALAAWLDVDPSRVSVRDELPASLAAVAERVSHARVDAERSNSEAQRQTLNAVKRLTKLGLSRRDTAELLGLSHQRVQQLLQAG